MSALDDAIATLAAAKVTFDTANTARYNAQMASDAAATALSQAQTNFNSVLENALAAINTPEVVATAQISHSSVTALLLAERNAGIQGAATYIQANPTTETQAGALAAWTSAALAATNLPALLQDPNVLFTLYATNLVNMKVIPDTSWASIVAWIVATPLATILAD